MSNDDTQNETGIYEDRLAEAAMKSTTPLEGGWRPMAVYPCFVGVYHPDRPGVSYMATPGWEGDALPIECHTDDGRVEGVKVGDVIWAQDIESDLDTWRSVVGAAINAHQKGGQR